MVTLHLPALATGWQGSHNCLCSRHVSVAFSWVQQLHRLLASLDIMLVTNVQSQMLCWYPLVISKQQNYNPVVFRSYNGTLRRPATAACQEALTALAPQEFTLCSPVAAVFNHPARLSTVDERQEAVQITPSITSSSRLMVSFYVVKAGCICVAHSILSLSDILHHPAVVRMSEDMPLIIGCNSLEKRSNCQRALCSIGNGLKSSTSSDINRRMQKSCSPVAGVPQGSSSSISSKFPQNPMSKSSSRTAMVVSVTSVWFM